MDSGRYAPIPLSVLPSQLSDPQSKDLGVPVTQPMVDLFVFKVYFSTVYHRLILVLLDKYFNLHPSLRSF